MGDKLCRVVSVLTVEDIDRELAEWRQKLTAASNNVMELIGSLTWRRLTGQLGEPVELQGVTRERAGPALAALKELWQSFSLVSDVLDRAAASRKALPRLFVSQDKLLDIDQLLNGPSVKLPPVQTPLAQRGLLTPAEIRESVTPDRLLQAMVAAFDTAKGVLLEVDDAWTHLEPALQAAEAEARKLQDEASRMGEGAMTELQAAVARLDRLRTQVQADPLGVQDGFTRDIRPLVDGVSRRLAAISKERTDVLARLADARRTVGDLEALRQRCDQAWARCFEVIEGAPPGARKDPQLLDSLRSRLDHMDAHLKDRSWTCAQVDKGLQTWQVQAAAFRDGEEGTAGDCERLVAEREELRGLLAAYTRRAEKRGVLADGELASLHAEAEFHLSPPQKTPLGKARLLVSQYRERIATLTGKEGTS